VKINPITIRMVEDNEKQRHWGFLRIIICNAFCVDLDGD